MVAWSSYRTSTQSTKETYRPELPSDRRNVMVQEPSKRSKVRHMTGTMGKKDTRRGREHNLMRDMRDAPLGIRNIRTRYLCRRGASDKPYRGHNREKSPKNAKRKIRAKTE
jgi:hypothetical protein